MSCAHRWNKEEIADALIHGGPALDSTLTLLFDLIYRNGPPASCLVCFRKDLYKGKGKDRGDWLSYRGIVLLSNLSKCMSGCYWGG